MIEFTRVPSNTITFKNREEWYFIFLISHFKCRVCVVCVVCVDKSAKQYHCQTVRVLISTFRAGQWWQGLLPIRCNLYVSARLFFKFWPRLVSHGIKNSSEDITRGECTLEIINWYLYLQFDDFVNG